MVIFLSWLLSLAISAFIYPNHFLTLDRKFMNTPDAGIPFVNTFALVNQFFNGGIQLFDRHDQLNFAYSHMSAGVYSLDNIVTAIFYALISPLVQHPGEAFHHVFCLFYYGFLALVRGIGGYLLLTRFTKDRLVIFISLVYLNTFLASQTMIDGHISQSLYSFLPLLLFFVLRFFQERSLNDFLAAVLMMMVGIASSPLFALGYFYLVVHFFILLCAAYVLFSPRLRQRWLSGWHWPSRPAWIKMGGAVALSALILLPTLVMVGTLKEDFFVADSGLGQTSGRISNAFKPLKYFQVEGKSFANPLDFFFRSVDFEHYVWPRASWVFLGMSILGLSVVGLVLARDRKKHIFALLIAAIVLMNVAPYSQNIIALYLFFKQGMHLGQLPLMLLISISAVVHWINVLTNPFSFLLRSFHVPTMFLPYVFLPLIALGLMACADIVRGRWENVHRNRVPWLMAAGCVMFIVCLATTTGIVRVYTCAGVVVFIVVLGIALWGGRLDAGKAWRLALPLAVLMAVDVAALKVYATDGLRTNTLVPEHFFGMPEGSSLIFGYQNPKLLAYREFLRPWPVAEQMTSIENYYGLFYQYTPINRYFDPPSIYSPVPMAYKDLHGDRDAAAYFLRERRIIDWREFGVSAAAASLGDILRSQAERHVITVEEDAPGLVRPDAVRFQAWAPPEEWRTFVFNRSEAKVVARRDGQREYLFGLPPAFPTYLATSVLTEDYGSMRLRAGAREFRPAQGKLTEPFSFDVQNVADRRLAVLLPGAQDLEEGPLELRVKMPAYLKDVWRNAHDQLGITMRVPKDGWMIIHYPFDKKWELSVDGRPSRLYRVNGYFMGTPLTQGDHQILLKYWPHTPLRWLLIVSMVVTAMTCEGLVLYAFWRPPRKACPAAQDTV